MDQHYNTRRLNQIFTVLNATALALIGVVLYKEHRPEWYPYQATYIQLYRQYAQQELQRARKALQGDAEYREISEKLHSVQQKLRSDPNYTRLRREEEKLDKAISDLTVRLGEIRLDYLHYEDEYFWARTQAVKVRYERLMNQLKPGINKLTAQLDDMQSRLERVREQIEELEKEERDLDQLFRQKRSGLERAEKAVQFSAELAPKIQQIHIPQLHLVDRCTTCHAGYDKPESWGRFINAHLRELERKRAPKGQIAILKALLPHPRQEELFSKHPIEKFGCTSCHQGQGVALKKDAAHAYNEKFWETPMLPPKYTEATCGKCHRYEITLAGAPKLTRGKQLFALMGCWGCHDAKGYDNLIKIGPSLTHIVAKTSPEWIFRWIKDPDAWSPNSRMPMFFLSDDEAWALVAYLRHASLVAEGKARPLVKKLVDFVKKQGIQPLALPKRYLGGDPARGQQLVKEIGCLGCHTVKGLGGPKEREKGSRLLGRYDFGPDLSKIGSKITNPDWLFNWLLEPKTIDPLARMPRMRLSEKEAADITAFLLTLKEPPTVRPVAFTSSPNLDDPKWIDQGLRLIANYGCHGCHAIPGTEDFTKIGKDLSDEADIDPHLIDFGKRVHEIFEKAPTYWDRKYIWLKEKLLHPRSFRDGLRMPDFKLSDGDTDALLTALLSFSGREIATLSITGKETPEVFYFRDRDRDVRIAAIAEGQKLVMGYNCLGCHIVEGYGGDIWPLLEDGMQPPNLQSQGFRVNHDWLFNFIKDPTMGSGRQHYIRPWLKTRMPTFEFDDEKISTLVRYFAALDNQPVFKEYRTPYKPDPKLAAVGKQLFETLQCMACHPTGAVQIGADVAQLAPSFQLAKERLQPGWIPQFILDPSKFQPGTRMPTFFPFNEETQKYESPAPEILGGDATKQAEALRDYLLTLTKPATVATDRR